MTMFQGERHTRTEHSAPTDTLGADWDTDADTASGQRSRGGKSTDDPVQLYLREIGQIPLLDATDELALAQLITRGQEVRALLHEQRHTAAEAQALWHELAQSNEARRQLIQANLRLVVSIAKKYIGGPLSFMDLIQEGNIGLMRAVEKYDYQRGHRFSTYATWWIRQGITRAIAEQSRLIRLPVHMTEAIGQLRRAVRQLEQALGREPTIEEIAVALGVDVRKVQRLLQVAAQPLSIEQPISNDGEGQIGELLTTDEADEPMEVITQRLLQEELAAALLALPERERKVLQLRYGLEDGHRYTLEEVGVVFGITRERTRQIEAEALRHLRRPHLSARLQAYLE